MITPAERSSIARLAANSRWAKESDRSAATAKAREKSPTSLEHFLEKVDPDKVMPYPERVKRAENARTAHYQTVMRDARAAKAAKAAGSR